MTNDKSELEQGGEEEVSSQLILPGEGESVADSDDEPSELKETQREVTLLEPKGIYVMQSRASSKPAPERIEAAMRAIKDDRQKRILDVYQNKTGTAKYAPTGLVLQEAYSQLERFIPVYLITVSDPKRAAEIESCRANEGNGQGRSDADKRYQAAKAVPFLEEELGRPPKPKELADFTLTSQKFCNSFLRSYYARKELQSPEYETDSGIPNELERIENALKKIQIPANWSPGEITNPIISNIRKELHRFSLHGGQEPEVKLDELQAFMAKHNLDAKAMGKLADVNDKTISRWLKGKTKISVSNMRNLHRVLAMDEKAIAVILAEEGGDVRE